MAVRSAASSTSAISPSSDSRCSMVYEASSGAIADLARKRQRFSNRFTLFRSTSGHGRVRQSPAALDTSNTLDRPEYSCHSSMQ
jgi:hypothetical protein